MAALCFRSFDVTAREFERDAMGMLLSDERGAHSAGQRDTVSSLLSSPLLSSSPFLHRLEPHLL